MKVDRGRVWVGRFSAGTDLLEELNTFCRSNAIRLGVFSVIGAVRSACLGYYDQIGQCYVKSVDLEGKFEIAACNGNVSIKDGDIFVHAHITLGDSDGKAFAGHLMPGAVVFAAEYWIQELLGPDLIRGYDTQTGLSLWNLPL